MNTNFLENVNFSLVLKRAPKVEFFGKGITLPSISISPVLLQNQFSTIKEQGDHMTFAPLDVTFRVDENLENYKEIFNWMKSIAFPENFEQYGRPKSSWKNADPIKSDIEILLYSSKNNVIQTITYKDAWPTDLSSFIVDIEQEQVVYPEITATFEYDTFDMV